MKVSIDRDEAWPFYSINKDSKLPDAIEMSEEDYQKHLDYEQSYDAWQDWLSMLYKTNARRH